VRITTRHVFTIPGFSARRGFCRDKARAWADRHGFDWRDFVRNGIDSEKVEAIDDGFAQALVNWARKCEAKEQDNG